MIQHYKQWTTEVNAPLLKMLSDLHEQKSLSNAEGVCALYRACGNA